MPTRRPSTRTGDSVRLGGSVSEGDESPSSSRISSSDLASADLGGADLARSLVVGPPKSGLSDSRQSDFQDGRGIRWKPQGGTAAAGGSLRSYPTSPMNRSDCANSGYANPMGRLHLLAHSPLPPRWSVGPPWDGLGQHCGCDRRPQAGKCASTRALYVRWWSLDTRMICRTSKSSPRHSLLGPPPRWRVARSRRTSGCRCHR